MILYSQKDPRWSYEFIGRTKYTIGKFGCLITCIAMLTTYFRPDKTPDRVSYILKFTDQALLIWDSCIFENFRFYHRAYHPSLALIKEAIKDKDRAVVLQVHGGTHWVVATGINWLTGKIQIADPLYGDRATMDRYNNTINGAAFFKRT